MTGRLAQAFRAATDWLLRIRIAVHAAAGRRQDHLRFTLQEAIARKLGYKLVDHRLELYGMPLDE